MSATATVGGVLLFRRGLGITVSGVVEGGRIRFMGGRFGEHTVDAADSLRVLTHWEGYCAASGLAISEGTVLSYHASSALRRVRVVSRTHPEAASCKVSGFRYIGNGKLSAMRRVQKHEVTVLQQPSVALGEVTP